MPRASIDLEKLNPLGRAIVDFLYDQRPSWTVSQLAKASKLNSQTIWNLIYGRGKPSRQTLAQIADVMERYRYMIDGKMVTYEFLCTLADLPDAGSPWENLENHISHEIRIPQKARAKLISVLRETEAEYRHSNAS